MPLFRKKESDVKKKARQNSESCARAIEIIRRCDEVADKEIRDLARTLKPVNPEIDEAWFRKIVNMGKMGYLAYVDRTLKSGVKPSSINKYVKDTLEGHINQVRQVWESIARQL